VLGHQVAAAGFAELPEAFLGLVIDADVVLAFCYAQRFDWAAGSPVTVKRTAPQKQLP
jgi:hypothetical protein